MIILCNTGIMKASPDKAEPSRLNHVLFLSCPPPCHRAESLCGYHDLLVCLNQLYDFRHLQKPASDNENILVKSELDSTCCSLNTLSAVLCGGRSTLIKSTSFT